MNMPCRITDELVDDYENDTRYGVIIERMTKDRMIERMNDPKILKLFEMFEPIESVYDEIVKSYPFPCSEIGDSFYEVVSRAERKMARDEAIAIYKAEWE